MNQLSYEERGMNQLSEKAATWFADRGIDPETAVNCGVYTTKHDSGGDVIVFAYKEHGEVVNAKFRGQGKRFWQSKDGKQTFWNFDTLLDPSLRGENPARLVICEGEMDALTGIECGFPLTVSVPSGAPSRPSEGDIDPETDSKFRFLWNCWDELKDVREIVVAVDNDEPGKVLGNELVRRLGVDRCYFVECPDDCKDLNDVLLRHGKSGVEQAINEAKPYPIKGLYRLADFPDLPRPQTYSTGWRWLDEYLRVWLGSLVLVTGIPGHGKTTFVSALVLNVALENDWTVCFASFELVPAPFHRDVIRQYLKRKPASEQTSERRSTRTRGLTRTLFSSRKARRMKSKSSTLIKSLTWLQSRPPATASRCLSLIHGTKLSIGARETRVRPTTSVGQSGLCAASPVASVSSSS